MFAGIPFLHSRASRFRLLLTAWLGAATLATALVGWSQTPGKMRWKLSPEETGGWSGSAIGPDGTVYVSLCAHSGTGVVYALEGTSGSIKWQCHSTCFNSTPAVGDNGTVYVGGDNQVLALDAADGTVRWTYSGGAYSFDASPGIGADGTVYIGCNDKNLYALDGVTGEKRWAFLTGGQIHEAPAIGVNGTIYTGSADGKLYALDSATGLMKWVFATGGPVLCSPAIGKDGTVYFGSVDHKIYAVNVITGKKRWEYLTEAAVDWSPLLADDMLVTGSRDGVMYSLSAETGASCWSLPFGRPFSRAHPTFGTDNNLYFGGPGWLAAVNHITKDPAWLFNTSTSNNFTANIGADGTIYFGSDNGPFYAIWSSSLGGMGESPWPAPGQNIRHTCLAPSQPGILNEPESQSVELGGVASLTAVVVGRPPLSFQWMLNGMNVPRATSVSLILTNLQASKLGDYTLVVTNQYGSVTSARATLGLNLIPTITLQPQDQTVAAGGSVKLSVAATNGSPLSYQWQLNAANLGGATQPDLLITNAGAENAGVYRAAVSNSFGTALSAEATLVVVMPASLGIAPNGLVSLTGTAGGTYRLESAHDLIGASWSMLTNLTFLSNTISFSPGAFTNSGRAFFRAVTTQ